MPKFNRQITRSRDRQIRRPAGFTLIEAALTTVIVGTGVLALVGAQQAYQIKNDFAVRANLGQMLANEIRELTAGLPHHDPVTGDANLGPEPGETTLFDWDDLDDFAGAIDGAGFSSTVSLNPPVNATGVAIPNLDRWTQEIRVSNVATNNISVAQGSTLQIGVTDVMRVTVTIRYRENNGTQSVMNTMTWIVPEG